MKKIRKNLLQSFLASLQSGRLTKYFFLASFFIITSILFVKMQNAHDHLTRSEKISIPLKNYRIIKPQKKQDNDDETTPGKGNGSSSGGVDLKKAYLSKVLYIINHEKRYPSYEKRRGFEDKVTLTLTIQSDGRISHWKLVQKSRFPGFNSEAERLMNAVVFPAFIDGLNMKEITIRFSIVFRIEE